MKLIFLVSFSISTTALAPPEPIDFIEDAILKYVNHSADPCDDFYRHACPYSAPKELFTTSLKNVYDYLNNSQLNSYWNKLDVYNDFEQFGEEMLTFNDSSNVVEFYTKTFRTVCEERRDLLPEISERIGLMTLLPNAVETEEETMRRRKRNSGPAEESCESAAEELKTMILEILLKHNKNTSEFGFIFMNSVTELIKLARGISSHLNVDVRQGIEETRKMVKATMRIAENLIKDTPWAKNEHVVKKIERITSMLALHDNYGADFKLVTDTLFGLERNYTECKTRFKFIERAALFCFISTAVTFDDPKLLAVAFTLEENAFNAHPALAFGYPNYYHSQYGREMSTKLGYTGAYVGHEIGHTFFDNHAQLELLPYFSANVETCVQDQFNATCMEYKEESCGTTDLFLEENGADIFGLQMAYELLKNYYGLKITDMIERLQMTHEQAFFYAYAISFCKGPPASVEQDKNGNYVDGHSADNVRANVIVQLPGFQEAFKCPSDSRMMKSATKQCHIYGSEAPETRRRKFNY